MRAGGGGRGGRLRRATRRARSSRRCSPTCWSRARTGRSTRSWAAPRWRRRAAAWCASTLVPGRSTTAIVERIRQAVSAAPTATAAWFARPRRASRALDALRRRSTPARVAEVSRPHRPRAAAGPPPAHASARCSWSCPRENDVEQAARATCARWPQEAGAGGRGPALPGARPAALPRPAPPCGRRRCAAPPRCTPRGADACAPGWPRPRACCGPCSSRACSRRAWSRSRAGDEMTPEILLEALDEGGYRREDPVTAPGPGGPPRRHPRRVPARPRRARAHRVPRRHRGEPAQLRSRDPAHDGAPSTRSRSCPCPTSSPRAPCSTRCARALPERFAGRRELPALLEKIERGRWWSTSSPELLPLVPRRHRRPVGAPARRVDGGRARAGGGRRGGRGASTRGRARSARGAPDAAGPRAGGGARRRAEALAARLRPAPALHLREVDLERRGHAPAQPAGAPLRRRPARARPPTSRRPTGTTVAVPRQPRPRRSPARRPARGRARRRRGDGRSTSGSARSAAGFELPEAGARRPRRRRRLPGGGPPPPARPRQRARAASSPTSAT